MLRTLQSERRLAAALEPRQILNWIYATRLVITLAVFGAALLVSDFLAGRGLEFDRPGTYSVALFALATAAILTPVSYLLSHRRRREPGTPFLLSQAILDIGLANAAVYITGGYQSPFVSLFIALAAAYALILPLSASVPVALGTGLVYVLASTGVPGSGAPLPLLLLQMLMFTLVAVTTSVIAARLRVVRVQLRSVEGELRRLELDTADVLRIIPSGVLTLDADGRLVYLNLAATELLGLEVASTLGAEVGPLFEDAAPDLAAAVEETLRRGRRIRNREIELRPGGPRERGDETPSGHAPGVPAPVSPPVPVSVSSTVLQGAGGNPSYVLLLQDLRPVRQLEDLRLRTGRLEAVAELSASLAHELKNPLASVRSAAEQLHGRVFEDEDDRVLSRLIVRESDRLDAILREFSDFARVDVAQRRPVDVGRMMRDVLETAGSHPAAQGRATLSSEVLDELGGLWGDPELLHRALLNLVLNAIQVGDPSTPVTVRIVADALRPDLVPGEVSLGNPVRIRVIDDGPGIDPDDLPHIFDPFYTRRPGGSGLGLSIAHRAVQAHGGALLASSEPGQGATFAVVLPRRASRSRQIPQERRLDAAGAADLGAVTAAARSGADPDGR